MLHLSGIQLTQQNDLFRLPCKPVVAIRCFVSVALITWFLTLRPEDAGWEEEKVRLPQASGKERPASHCAGGGEIFHFMTNF